MSTTHEVRLDGVSAFIFSNKDGGQKLTLSGWSSAPNKWKKGDYLILPNGQATTRYQVDSVERMLDPPDQYFAELTFSPRTAQ